MRLTILIASILIFSIFSQGVFCEPMCQDKTKENVFTYPLSETVTDSPYKVTANGVLIPIEKAGKYEGAYYCRFQMASPVDVVVTREDSAELAMGPLANSDDLLQNGNESTFTITEPGIRFLHTKTKDGQWPLIIIAEEYDKQSQDLSEHVSAGQYFSDKLPRPIIDLADYDINDGEVATAKIQKALDDCSSLENGAVLYIGPGIYKTGTIKIGDNTCVYMAPGSVLQASDNPTDFPVDKGRKEYGTHGPVSSFSRVVMFDNCENSALVGYGVIDGNGHIIRNEHHRHVQLMDVTASKNIYIQNIILRNSAEWTLHVLGCKNVQIDDLRIINDWGVHNTDGIDPDCTENLVVRGYFGYCGDDAVAIKTTGNSDLLQPSRNIRFADCLVVCRKTSYKIGTETYADVSDVVFDNCEAYRSSRGIGLWMRDGSKISDVRFYDIRLDLMEILGEGWSGEPIRITLGDRHGVGVIEDVLFHKVHCSSPYRMIVESVESEEKMVRDIVFLNSDFTALAREDKLDRKVPFIEMHNAGNIAFINTTVTWADDNPEHWSGLIYMGDCENIYVDGLEEIKD